MCSFTKKASASGASYRGSASGPRWGTSVPQTLSLLLCPPNNPVRSTPLGTVRRRTALRTYNAADRRCVKEPLAYRRRLPDDTAEGTDRID